MPHPLHRLRSCSSVSVCCQKQKYRNKWKILKKGMILAHLIKDAIKNIAVIIKPENPVISEE
jgi:hypothetical protein